MKAFVIQPQRFATARVKAPLAVTPFLSFEPCWREPHPLVRECPNLAGEHEPSYMILTARTLEHVLLVTRNHHGFVRRRLDQVHLTAARKTPQVDRPFTFNSER
jgi:hypothetical protein